MNRAKSDDRTPAPLILAINHDSTLLEVIQELLQHEGYRATTHLAAREDPLQMLAVVREVQPDLVVLDVPFTREAEAWQVLDALVLHPETSRLGFVVTTTDSRALRERETKLKSRGIAALLKPFDLQELLDAVQQHLGDRTPST